MGSDFLASTIKISGLNHMKRVFYEKRGDEYVQVSEYDADVMNSLPLGHHLITVTNGGRSTTIRIKPEFAPMIAAGQVARDAISRVLMTASALRASSDKIPLTERQARAWEELAQSFGQTIFPLEWPSYREAAEAGVQAMIDEQERLLTNPTVRNTYEKFLLIAALTDDGETP
jgi:hypothetical protein